ncbi:hypothetical protein HN592_05225 [Candidatus Woesearchaeota archaeon]|jgi:hypothetical protein|nr:hypothetical protein [Candidatus Woesearchaeota archaeon]MBT4367787.1 hypothetical protein [Candidatus Woesearchaeota archaeon]MBT4712275.1 hypothetical protein [Candidatus Woesearchaeota archaeon]MBT6638823.1 hypothetical protein [Candidatus Woesearchaeota archaeon]MBT7134467.1 hypothetical protein [Candidatus Woesearchaeota archaeon]
MEFGIKIKNIEQLGSVKDKYNFIYFGDECCERKIPGLSFAQKVFEYCIKKGKTPVLLSPLVTDSGIKKLRVLIKELYILKEDFELTINDFGVLNLMKEFPNIKINCGRLLIKMKKGPEILSTVLSKNVETFKANSLTNKLYINFLKNNGVGRFETDLPEQGIKLPAKENITLYLGNVLLSLTRRCPFIDCDQENFTYSIKDCKKECEDYCVVKNTKFHEKLIFMLGNAEFLKVEIRIDPRLKGKVNRILVFQGMLDLV